MGSRENGHNDGPMKVGLESSPPLANENGNVVLHVEALLRSCSMKGLSPRVAERIRQADADQDGHLSVDELIEVIRTEMRAVSDRKLFRNLLISLFVAVLVLVATLCGTVYAIVELSKEVKNDNGVLVSSSSGDVMATGTAQRAMTVGPELLTLLELPESLSKAHSVVIPAIDGGNSTVYKVAKMTSSPSAGTVEVRTVDGTTLSMNLSGVYEVSSDGTNTHLPLFVSGGSRRRLMSDGDWSPENEGATVVMDTTSSSSSNDNCEASNWLLGSMNVGLSACELYYPDEVNNCACRHVYQKYWDRCSAEPDSNRVKQKLQNIGKDYECVG
eukprot:jgi/Picsp_1/3638/NSC_06475-R1_---NA---